MKILLVEDDEDKREDLISFILNNFDSEYKEVRSFQTALKTIQEENFDLILLDMTIPTFDITPSEGGGRSQPFGGEMLLHEIVRRKIQVKVIIVTQFDVFGKGDELITVKDLDRKLSEKFSNNYVGTVQYKVSYTGWKELLLNKIHNINFN
jgi:CheY-like chemotaxis protein